MIYIVYKFNKSYKMEKWKRTKLIIKGNKKWTNKNL